MKEFMLKNLCCLVVIFAIGAKITCQDYNPDVVYKNNVLYLFTIEGVGYKVENKKIRYMDKYIVYQDTVPLDTINTLGYEIYCFNGDNSVYFLGNNLIQKFNPSIKSYEFERQIVREMFSLSNGNIVVGEESTKSYYFSQKLWLYNIEQDKLTPLISTVDNLKKVKYKIGSVIESPITGKYLIEAGLYDGGGFVEYQHLIYSANEGTVTDYPMNDKLGVDGIDGYGDYLLLNNGDYILIGEFLLDPNFNLKTRVLSSSKKIVGYKIKNKILENYYLESLLDDGTEVFIPVTFDGNLEISLYKIKNQLQLTKEELKKFPHQELWILKNMVFAKHNYKFNNEYLQAYFNRYVFYGVNKESHTKDITLTEVDKKNLELIQSRMKKVE